MRRTAWVCGIVAVLAGCGDAAGGSGGSTGPTSGASTGPGPATEAPPTTTEGPPTGGSDGTGGAGGTTLDPTNAFTDSSQLTEAPGETGTPPPGPHVCEASGLCFDPGGCVECSVGSDCADEFAACLAVPNGECEAYSDCLGTCDGDPACVDNCAVIFPNGFAPAWALSDCSLCTVCGSSCAAYAAYCGGGGGGPPPTTCDMVGDCQQCLGCSAIKDCAGAVQACMADPTCQPYQTCLNNCPADDMACPSICQDTYPVGYDLAWAQFDCAVCTACPSSCVEAQAYCQAGGGGPGKTECTTQGDCVEISDSLPYCVGGQCVECLTDDDCFDIAFPTCVANFCK